MKKRNFCIYPFVLIPIFVWIGFVCSISFMEAWLKFRAPNVTLPIGLGIGKLIFAVLNAVEWFLAGLVVIFSGNKIKNSKGRFLFYGVIFILSLQTAFLLPILNQRADAIMCGESVAPSFIHLIYLFFEILKVLLLFAYGIKIIRDLTQNNSSC